MAVAPLLIAAARRRRSPSLSSASDSSGCLSFLIGRTGEESESDAGAFVPLRLGRAGETFLDGLAEGCSEPLRWRLCVWDASSVRCFGAAPLSSGSVAESSCGDIVDGVGFRGVGSREGTMMSSLTVIFGDGVSAIGARRSGVPASVIIAACKSQSSELR